MRPLDENELEIYDLAEDAPQIAGIVDERPEEVRVMSQYRETKKWKIVTREYEDVKVSAIKGSDSDLSPPRGGSRSKPEEKKRNIKRKPGDSSDSDVSVERRKNVHSDASPPRKTAQKHIPPQKKRTKSNDDSDASPPRKNKHIKHKSPSDSDASPPRKRKLGSGSDASPKRWQKHDHERMRSRDSLKKHRYGDSSHRGERSDRPHKGDRKDGEDRERSEKVGKTLEGKKAGLQNAADMKKEAAEIRRRQAESLVQVSLS